jgi:hypothetical protein
MIIFLGDYIDPYPEEIPTPIGFQKQYKYKTYNETVKVLNDIIDYKKKNKNVILLLGNHDTHYLFNEIYGCSRYDHINCGKFEKIYRDNIELFQYAYQDGNNLFTHAGVTNKWVNIFNNTLQSYGLKKDYSNMADVINKMGETESTNRILNVVGETRGGNSLAGGPTWADYNETERDYLKGINQYVGHNQVYYIFTQKIKELPGSITYCDVLGHINPDMSLNYKLITI